VVDHGALYLTTGPRMRAGRNVVQNPQVVLLFSGERSGHRTELLRLRGKATCHRRLPSWQVLLRAAAKYYVSPRGLPVELRNAGKWRLRTRYYGQVKGGFGYLQVVPTGAEFLALP
jgi:hypothetical protein